MESKESYDVKDVDSWDPKDFDQYLIDDIRPKTESSYNTVLYALDAEQPEEYTQYLIHQMIGKENVPHFKRYLARMINDNEFPEETSVQMARVAVENGNITLVDLLLPGLTFDQQDELLTIAINVNQIKMVKYLISKGVRLEYYALNTFLYVHIGNRKFEIFDILTDNGLIPLTYLEKYVKFAKTTRDNNIYNYFVDKLNKYSPKTMS